jgi:hypothetical protein
MTADWVSAIISSLGDEGLIRSLAAPHASARNVSIPGSLTQLCQEFFMLPKDVVTAWVSTFNRADVETLAGFYREDAINHQVAEQPVEGRDAIREMFAAGFDSAKMVCSSN